MKKGLITIVSALGLTVSGCVTDGVGYVDSSPYYSSPVYYEPSPIIITPPPIIYGEHHREQQRGPQFRHPPAFRHPGINIHRGRR